MFTKEELLVIEDALKIADEKYKIGRASCRERVSSPV